MNNKEAIEILNIVRSSLPKLDQKTDTKIFNAFRLAINALEKEEVDNE